MYIKNPFERYRLPDTPYQPTPQPQTGWVCPKCGRVHAPWMPSCNCATVVDKVTCTESADKIDC